MPITNDAITLGILIAVLALIFKTHATPAFSKFYKYVPALLYYTALAVLNSTGHIGHDGSRKASGSASFF